jgi:hypothetical protein
MVLLAAMDSLKRQLESCPVADFVKSLFEDKTAKAILESFAGKPILKGRIFFNHFARLQVSASADSLAYYFIRGAAITGHPEQFGWDHCIPVCLADGRLTALLIKVHNYAHTIRPADVDGERHRMRRSGSMLLNPASYESNSAPGKRDSPEEHEGSLDALSMSIMINLLQGEPTPSDANSAIIIEPLANFVAVQGFSLSAFSLTCGGTRRSARPRSRDCCRVC